MRNAPPSRSADPDLAKIWEISWRTARLDAHETYMDTPYYEQLQYIGDTRIQALISYAVAGDDRLARQALAAFDDSRSPTASPAAAIPAPCRRPSPPSPCSGSACSTTTGCTGPIPTPVRASLPGTRAVLDWFATHEQPDGLLAQTPLVELHRLGLDRRNPHLRRARRILHDHARIPRRAQRCRRSRKELSATRCLPTRDRTRAAHVRAGIYDKCWNADRGLLADNPDQKDLQPAGQHPRRALRRHSQGQPAAAVLRKMLAIEPGTTPDGVLSASYYFRFYLARALDHAGLADEYLDSLDPWRKLLPLHFSTWPEIPGDTRSDSHAWSAHPIYDLLTLVAGIEPASPGFATVRIAPHLGSAQLAHCQLSPSRGRHSRSITSREGEALDATITLPGHLTGTFEFHGKALPALARPKPHQSSR